MRAIGTFTYFSATDASRDAALHNHAGATVREYGDGALWVDCLACEDE